MITPRENYVDLQVNGYAGVDFNCDDLGAEAFRFACAQMRDDGVGAFLATIITDTIAAMTARIARVAALMNSDPEIGRMAAGIHIEGPFISHLDGYRGAHPADAVLPATVDVAQRLLDAGAGLVRMVTLAPESDPACEVTRRLSRSGVIVAGGHSDASLHQLRAASDAGLTLWTHLGNGCPAVLPRHDNIVQRVLSLHERITPTFIADGVHVPLFALKNYLSITGASRAIVVTDAMAAASLGPGRYTLGRWTVDVGEDRAAWAPGRAHLVGSASTMRHCATLLAGSGGLASADIGQLTADNAARLLGLREDAPKRAARPS